MRYSTIICMYGMICDVERKPSFCALKSFKVGFIGVRSNVPFFRKICVVKLSCYFFFSHVGLKSDVWKTASFLSSCIPVYFYSPRSYMMNVLPSNTARGATTRSQPQWTRELPHRLEECCHAAQILFGRAFIVSYCC